MRDKAGESLKVRDSSRYLYTVHALFELVRERERNTIGNVFNGNVCDFHYKYKWD